MVAPHAAGRSIGYNNHELHRRARAVFTVLQVSDTHLSARIPRFNANWAVAARVLAMEADCLIVHTGDAALDGPDHEEDLAFAARLLRSGLGPQGQRLRCTPGNHDVGDPPSLKPRQPATDRRVAAHAAALGPASWVEDVSGWRLIGLNSQVLGSGTAAEAAQQAMLAEALLTLGARRLAVFLHKPPFLDDPQEPVSGYWTVPPEERAALSPLFDHPSLRLVASGHLHLARIIRRGDVVHAWCPATSFLVGPALLADPHSGARTLGLMRHRFLEDEVESELVPLPDAEPILFDPIAHEIYPPAPA
ncbi:metallophosphoesterase [Elioraea tepida]|jgi:alkaline phosphatase D|uniref:Metallophosphoesterase n=1 Tax=Elioraea tepida TaxID=2843330 RepID=A0A975U2D0_9PROT|nr:metallophosphoesterase [Elioraea tepida]QXM25141.1 metallophosphoesterase [Elioraea tepida]